MPQIGSSRRNHWALVWLDFTAVTDLDTAPRGKAIKAIARDLKISREVVRFDRNRFSVMAKAARRAVQVRAYADRIMIRYGGEVVVEHRPLRPGPTSDEAQAR